MNTALICLTENNNSQSREHICTKITYNACGETFQNFALAPAYACVSLCVHINLIYQLRICFHQHHFYNIIFVIINDALAEM